MKKGSRAPNRKVLNERELRDYWNQFSSLLSAKKQGERVLNWYVQRNPLLMPAEYVHKRYPENYPEDMEYPASFRYKALQVVLNYASENIQTIERWMEKLLKVVRYLLFNEKNYVL
jgi:hypothetical protein